MAVFGMKARKMVTCSMARGAPFKTKFAPLRRAQMERKNWSIAPVFDGFVARRKDTMPAETNTPNVSVGGNITTLAEPKKTVK